MRTLICALQVVDASEYPLITRRRLTEYARILNQIISAVVVKDGRRCLDLRSLVFAQIVVFYVSCMLHNLPQTCVEVIACDPPRDRTPPIILARNTAVVARATAIYKRKRNCHKLCSVTIQRVVTSNKDSVFYLFQQDGISHQFSPSDIQILFRSLFTKGSHSSFSM